MTRDEAFDYITKNGFKAAGQRIGFQKFKDKHGRRIDINYDRIIRYAAPATKGKRGRIIEVCCFDGWAP